MSSNIIDLSGRRMQSVMRVTPAAMVHNLRALWVAGVISQDAFFLGVMALGTMQQLDLPTVALCHAEAIKAHVETRGQIFTGRVTDDRVTFILALQDLHFKVGMLNHFDAMALDEPDAADRHFTRYPGQNSDSRWNRETPIFVRLPKESAEAIQERVSDLFRQQMAKSEITINVTL